MPISRRTALRQTFIIASGTIFLPACLDHPPKEDNAATLEALADTLIPADATQGAKATGACLFAQKMMRDCYPDKQQQSYARGLQAFEAQAKKQYGRSFVGCDQSQRNAFVAALDKTTPDQGDLAFFYHENKRLLIQGFLGSQYFLTKIEVYELVPAAGTAVYP